MFNEFDFKIFSLILKGTPKEVVVKGLIVFIVIALIFFKKKKRKNSDNIINKIKGNNNIQAGRDVHVHLHNPVFNESASRSGMLKSFFEKYILKYPTNDKGYAQLAYSYYRLSSKTQIEYTLKSKQAFLKAIDLGYKDGMKGLVWDRLGHLEEYLENDREAEQYFKEAVLLDEKNFSYCLGSCYLKQKKYKEAFPYLEKSAKEYNPDELSWFNLGSCYVNLNKINKGKEAFETAIDINPEYDPPYFELGGIALNQGNKFKAFKIWAAALDKFPNSSYAEKIKDFLA